MEWLHEFLNADQELFLYLNGFNNSFWDTVMFFVTRTETWLPLFVIILFYIFNNYKNKTFIILVFLALAILSSDQLSVFLKETVQRLRPVHDPDIQDMVHNYYRKGGLYGFISSHASNAFTFLVYSAYIFRNRFYSYTFLIWAILVSYSRIYLGVHYPFDIAGGIILGSLLGYLFYRILMFVENHFFISRQPKISTTNLSRKNMSNIFLVLIVTVVLLLIVTRNLYYHQIL